MKITDNYLPEEIFKTLQRKVMNENFSWNFFDYSVDPGDRMPQMVHTVCMNNESQSSLWNSAQFLIKFLNPSYIYRMKLNLDIRTKDIVTKQFHYDIVNEKNEPLDHQVMILYMNTCNGYTLFEDGTKVHSVENRALFFPGDLKHTGTTCTDELRRIVLNCDYRD
jgi:hypothetical protein